VNVLIIGVALADIAGQAVHSQVHLAQANSLGYPLLPKDADGFAGVGFVSRNKARGLHKHAATAAAGVVYLALVWV